MKNYLFSIMLLCCSTIFAAIPVQVEPSSAQLGETIRVIFTLDDPRAAGLPDLTPLQQDFKIVGTERSTAYSIVNGQTSTVGQWIILLTAKKAGILTIPAILIGNQQTTPTSITISENPSVDHDDDSGLPADEVMLRTQVSNPEPLVNEQVIYTVKLYNSQRLMDAEYHPPRIEDALMVSLGDGRRYRTTVNGQQYTVEEQQYAIFPQKSGSLKVISPAFNALIFDTVPRRVNLQEKASVLKVKPIPATYKNKEWLPAKNLTLSETYDQPDATLSQGSTLVRTITLDVLGLPAELLPPLILEKNTAFNHYVDKPVLENKFRPHELMGSLTVKVTYLLNTPGDITIPELRIPWFNTKTGQEDVAVLPARVIHVQARAQEQRAKPTSSADMKLGKVEQVVGSKSQSPLAWWLAGGFAFAWILTLILWWHKQNRGSQHNLLKHVKTACAADDPHQAEAALLRWASAQWPSATLLNLQQLSQWVHDATLKKQLSILSQALYSQDKHMIWRGSELWRSIASYSHGKPGKKRKNNDLPPINPI